VFESIDYAEGFFTEPVACWLWVPGDNVHPICALGGDVCDATVVENYIGVVGPGGDVKQLFEAQAERAAQVAKP